MLAGLPVLIKDETAVADVRMTMGTKLFESNVPFESHPMVQAIERNGGVVLGMTNMPGDAPCCPNVATRQALGSL